MRRRAFLPLIYGMAMWPLAAAAQPTASRPVVGILWPSTEQIDAAFSAAIHNGLRAEGYVEGQNVELAMRYANGDFTRFTSLAAELVALKPSVIVTASDNAVRAVHSASPTIPLVALFGGDPVAQGYATTLAPGWHGDRA